MRIGRIGAFIIALASIAAPHARKTRDVMRCVLLARSLNLPRRLVTILEGESLVNDASALILYRSAVAAACVIVIAVNFSVKEPDSYLLPAVPATGKW